MKTLAIKGEESRGEEIKEILECFGGKTTANLSFEVEECIYYIPANDNRIKWNYISQLNVGNFTLFTVDEFKEKFKFKVGDLVRLGETPDEIYTVTDVRWDYEYGEVMYEIDGVHGDWYRYSILSPIEKKRMTNEVPRSTRLIDNLEVVEVRGNEVEIVLDSCDSASLKEGRIRIVRNLKYPKNYEECCKVLGITFDYPDIRDVSNTEFHLHSNFIRLIRYRDAYWKIAGLQMGLNKPWKPTYETLVENTYFTIHTFNGEIDRSCTSHRNSILAFPTEEMRDTFYENCKDLIEACKELL